MIDKKRVGYTTGVFDLFHIGHLNILKTAFSRCDFLIVGVTTDELCNEVKGITPIIPLEERLEILKSIKYVSKVVTQSSMDKLIAWNQYKFDIVFVGDDWKGTKKWDKIENDFSKVNVSIDYLPYTKHTSSTNLRQILRSLSKGLE